MIDPINHLTEAVHRLTTLYKTASNFIGLLTPFMVENNKVEKAMQDILLALEVKTAQGIELDILGKIIGMVRPRVLRVQDEGIVLVFSGSDGSLPNTFPQEAGWDVGIWQGTGEADFNTVPISDEKYRRLLDAKIRLNYFDGSVNSTITAVHDLLDAPANITIDETIPLQPVLTVHKTFTAWEHYVFKDSYTGSNPTTVTSTPLTIFKSYIYPVNSGILLRITDI